MEDKKRAEEEAASLGFSKVSELKRAVTERIQGYVANGGFLFAMCSATDSYDVARAAHQTDVCAAVFDGDYLAVAGGQFLVIRPQESALLPGYLRWFLNLPGTQETLAGCARGSYVRSLPANALGELEIPIPPIPQQHAIAALHALRLREKDLMARLAARRAVFLDQSILHSFRA